MISSGHSDAHLESILFETVNWSVIGDHGVDLCEVASLRLAIDKAVQFAAGGRAVVALMRRQRPEIVVLPGQVQELTKMLVALRNSSSPRGAVFMGRTENGSDRPPPVLTAFAAAYH